MSVNAYETIRGQPMSVNVHDRDVLRRLAEQKAKIAALPVQKQRKEMWSRLNRLGKVKPLVWLNEVCWREMNVNDELTIQTTDPFCQSIETELRHELYQWEHMPGDMVIEPEIDCPLAISNTGFGIKVENAERIGLSRHFKVQIQNENDIEKIKDPVITHDLKLSEERFQIMSSIFDGIIPVCKTGQRGFWFAPWDALICWTGVTEALTDMALRPDYINAVINRLVEAYLKMLDQYEALGLLALNNNNTRIGSGAYGYTDELPQKDFNAALVKTKDLWGCAVAQIFSDVSPEMHWEFALQHELRWLERFSLNYYGCCEPLHTKLEILKRVPRLRKISVSAWMDVNKAVKEAGGKYVFSLKPNPAWLAEDTWRPELARKELETKLGIMRECPVEIIMKDISTVRREPQRLWEWAKIAMETADKHARQQD